MKKIREISFFLSLVFFAAYANALGSKLLCDVAHLIDQSGVEHTHEFGHDHHHDEHVPDDHHSDKGHDHHDENENCCNELALAFFNNQSISFNYILVPKINYEYKHIALFSGFDSFSRFNLEHQKQIDLFDDDSPPPIPDIRVYINSFLI
ncbi:MAG: hypothetical protein H0X46_00190 [Bacteroidetes bacterium]|nr:hypothetical protein [Bacteroidota bacterium]